MPWHLVICTKHTMHTLEKEAWLHKVTILLQLMHRVVGAMEILDNMDESITLFGVYALSFVPCFVNSHLPWLHTNLLCKRPPQNPLPTKLVTRRGGGCTLIR